MRTLPAIAFALVLTACAATPDAPQSFVPEIRPVQTATHAARHQGATIELSTADALLADGKARPAFEAYQAVWLIDPEARAPQIGMARAAIAMGAVARATAIMDDLPFAGDDRDVRILLHALSGDCDDAELALNAALEIDMDNPTLWTLLSREYSRQGRIAESLDAAIRAKSLS